MTHRIRLVSGGTIGGLIGEMHNSVVAFVPYNRRHLMQALETI